VIKNKQILAIIPARGGSKRLPNKNILPLAGKPLIAWTIGTALASKYIDRVLVNTDCEEIAQIAKKNGAAIPFMRHATLATDTASTNEVVLDVINKFNEFDPEIVLILQPTSPLRNTKDIDDALELFVRKNADGVVSVCECEHPPYWSNTIADDGNMNDFIEPEYIGKRSQDLPECFRLNGAVYAFTKSSLIKNKGIAYTSKVFSFRMPVERSVDIDNNIDFQLASVLIGGGLYV